MIWVVDASVALRWFIEGEEHPHADAVLERMLREPRSFAVPELFLFETFAVLCRHHPAPRDAYEGGLLAVVNNGVFRQPMSLELARLAAGFVALGLAGYDATYAALARSLDGQWLTFDGKAHRRIAGEGVSLLLDGGLPPDW